jgi:3-hydroxyisobutyrate dehydrogenase/putative dehydrogenase
MLAPRNRAARLAGVDDLHTGKRPVRRDDEGASTMTQVGWIGLGAMGAPMAACVARAGFDVAAFDLDPARAAALAADGVKPADTVAAAATGVGALVLMVATPAQVEQVLFGDGDAAAALEPGAAVVIMATVGPDAVQDWARRLAAKDVGVVDAPVSGGVARARTGELVIMVGGAEPDVGRVRPLLAAMARAAPVVGPEPGDGQKFKLVNQLLAGVHIAAAAEGLAFAEAMGLDTRACWEVVRDGAAASFMLDDRGARMVDDAFDDPQSALDIFVKDMGLVTDAARRRSYPAPLATAAEQLYLAGRRAGLGRLDDSSVIEVLRGRLPAAPDAAGRAG